MSSAPNAPPSDTKHTHRAAKRARPPSSRFREQVTNLARGRSARRKILRDIASRTGACFDASR